MTTRVVHRPARMVHPVPAEPPLLISPPPLLPDGRSGGGVMTMLPLAGAGGAMAMMMFLRGSVFAALGAVVLVVSLGAAAAFYLTQRGQGVRKRRAQRELYMDYLEELRERLRAGEDELRRRSTRSDAPITHLLDVVTDPARRWERRRRDPDFLRIRVGAGPLPVRDLQMREEGSPVNPTDPFMRSEAQAVIRRFTHVPGMPLRVALDRAGDVSVVGADRAAVLTTARAILAQVVALHAPDDVTVAVLAPPGTEADWAWVRWLPHLLDRTAVGPDGPTPLLAPDPQTLAALLAADLGARAAAAADRTATGADRARLRPRLLVVDDTGGGLARPVVEGDLPALGVTVLHLVADRLHEPSEVSSRVTVDGEEVVIERLGSPVAAVRGAADPAPAPLVEGLARTLAPLRLSPDSYDDGTGTPPADFVSLVGFDPRATGPRWTPRSERDVLRVPLGVDDTGRPVLLDLKEAAALGMGPHGLCVGATGSGKSELLRTFVLALAATHPPEQLAMVLVDYKGGATFAPFRDLPHVAGLITNLAADAALVDRVYTSLDGEVLRRQQLLADAGGAADMAEYHLRRATRPELPAIPHLLVIIDEFGELLSAKPELVELLLRIGRIGRSIGVHLLLASQRVETGKLRGLETHLSYRIGLRTLSEMESRAVLDTPDAFALPPLPGNGYLKVDSTVYLRFKAAYVSGPAVRSDPGELAPLVGPRVKPMPFSGRPAPAARGGGARPTRRTAGPTLLSTVVDNITATAAAGVAPIWLAPLPPAVTLDQAAGGFDAGPDGVRLRTAPGVVIGLLDDPARQWQGPWRLDLDAGGGHLLVVGGPGSGKTTALRTIALALATARTPGEVGIYGVDLTGAGLRDLAGLPHVGGVAGRETRERQRRTVDEAYGMLAEREALFARHGFDTVADLRAAGPVPGLACTEVVLLVDGYGGLGGEFEDLAPRVHDLLARGGRYGVHVIASARRWNEVRAAQQVAFASRIELRMTEPAESTVDAKLARALPVGVPGRALTDGRLYAQLALPRLDGVPATDSAGSALAEAATLVRGAWTGPLPPPVRVLPAVLPAADLAIPDEAQRAPSSGVAFGRFENDFTPAVLDLFGRDQHLFALGDSGTGKTNLLRVLAAGLVRRYTSDELVFAVFDPRRGLADAVPEEYLGGYAPNPTLAQRLAGAVCTELRRRDPAAGGTGPAGPRIVLLVDDYDILAASATQPLGAFVPYVAAGRDLGLHVLMTRRTAGASRGLYEPFALAVRESGCVGLLLSGDRTEGQLFGGVRPAVLPVGRARCVRPGAPARTVQTAYLDPTASLDSAACLDSGEVLA